MDQKIICTTAFRSNPGLPIEHTEVLVLTTATSVMAVYQDLVFRANFRDEPQMGASIIMDVETSASRAPIMTVLYQLAQNARVIDQFVGGHGFTGLHYVHHPTSGAELQFWCAVDGDSG